MKKEGFNQKIREIAAKWDTSGFVMVYNNHQWIHQEAYGYQDRDKKIKCSLEDTFSLSLRSHFFLGLAVMVLLDQKKIRMEDKLDLYIPEYKHAKWMTIQQLLNHTSGIMDYFYSHKMLELQKDEHHQAKDEAERYQIERLLYAQEPTFNDVYEIVSNKELDFHPGKRDGDWSATNHVFLQEVIERISTLSLFDFLNTHVFIPWNMKSVTKGASATTVSYGCIQETKLVRLPIVSPNDMVITLGFSDLKALMEALVTGKTFKKASWKKGLMYNSEGYSLLSENANGIHCVEASYLGYEMNLYFDKENCLTYIHMTNELQTMKKINDEWFYFRKDMRSVIEAETTYPKNTRLEKYCEKNAWAAMTLKVALNQQSYVFDAKSSVVLQYM